MLQLGYPLTGIRFLVIEDELTQALLLQEMLEDMGGTVTDTAFGYEQARIVLHKDDFDCALLDVNLNGTLSFPIAEALGERGIPFVFCTGFVDGIGAYPKASRISVIDKPIQSEQLKEAVLSALSH
jgi:DNA-binding NtrC family response regulator